jgi:hypothetical protein
MQRTLLLLCTLLGWSTLSAQPCGDGTLYVSKIQTARDGLCDQYPKLDGFEGMPRFKEGNENLEKMIRSKLKLSEEARAHIFNLNFRFTVTCDGHVKDVKQIGAPFMDTWTNIVEIISATTDWGPAKKNGKPVDCISFGRMVIDVSRF